MGLEVITKEDLQQFRTQLINDLRELLIPKEAKLVKPWLRNSEVMKTPQYLCEYRPKA